MSTALAERPITAPAVTSDQLALITKTVAVGATPDELKLYLYDCARQGVHPLDKLIFFTKRKQKDGTYKYTPITSIDFMRMRAADSGEYAGSDDAVFPREGDVAAGEQPTGDFAARVTVWRLVQGQRCAFTATARWDEYKPSDDFMWRKMPHTMLAKCAEALALRKGFPRQLAGLYAKEELDQAGESHGYSVSAPVVSGPVVVAGEASRTVGPERGDSGHSHAPDVTRPHAPTGGTIAPAGCYRILQVQKQTGKVKGEVILVDHHGQEQKLPAFQDQLVALAERLCQDGVPVEADIKVAGTSQKPYLKSLRAALPEIQVNADVHTQPLTDKDIPFMWLLPLIGQAIGLLAMSRSLLS